MYVLTLTLLYLTGILCQVEFNYTVNDTIGTREIGKTSIDIDIYNPNQQDCSILRYGNRTLRFTQVYDFNRDFDKLDFFCTVLITDATTSSLVAGSIYVQVVDTNDHTPRFLQSSHKLSVSENFRGMYADVTTRLPTALDDDNPPYNVREYSLSGDSIALESFTLSPDSHTLINKKLIDREERSEYYFNLTAIDGGTPSRTSPPIFIELTIIDVNDHLPQFRPHINDFTISEDQAPGFLVGIFPADDMDEGTNADITYLLFPKRAYKDDTKLDTGDYSFPLYINETSAEVWLVGELDFESYDTLEFTVEADDLGQPHLFNTIPITLHITDVSDTPSQLIFTNVQNGILFVNENVRNTAESTLSIAFFDPPLPANATPSLVLITPQDNAYLFFLQVSRLHEWSVQLNGTLDRESRSTYELSFLLEVAELNVTRQNPINLTLTVLDYNDNAPYILDPPSQCISFPEDTAHKFLYTLKATDDDIEDNAILSYSILDAHGYESHFSVDSTSGVVELIEPLDYEEMSVLDVILAVTDAGDPQLTSTTTLTICLENINDTPIVFDDTFLFFPVNSPLHTKLFTIHATDKDDTSQEIFYFLGLVDDGNFVLDSKTGELFLTACLPHGVTTERTFYASHCPIRDNNSIECELASTQLNISVTERETLLEVSSYTVCLEMNKQENFTLSLLSNTNTSLNGTDLTISTNGSSFSVDVVDNHDSFVSHITCREHDLCNITLNHDCDTNHTESTSLNVLFVDEIQSTLQFIESVYEVYLDEGGYSDYMVKDFSRSICYNNYNYPVFSLSQRYQESPVRITEYGLLLLSGILDVDATNAITNYTFIIQAESNDVTVQTTLLLTVNPSNEYTPSFFNFSSFLNLTTYNPNYVVARFQAVDRDRGEDGRLFYNISIELSWLVLDESTGVLSISESFTSDFQFETNRTYNGTVTVWDRGSPPRSESRRFRVFLHDRITVPVYWHFLIIAVCILVAILILDILLLTLILCFCRYKHYISAKFYLNSTSSSTDFEVVENANAASLRDSIANKPTDPLKYSTPRSSGVGVSIDSTAPSVVPMTDKEIREIILANLDLFENPGPVNVIIDFNEGSRDSPVMARQESDLHLEFADEFNRVSEGSFLYEPPVDVIFANQDTKFWGPSHSPQSSASSSYLSSASHYRPRIPYNSSPQEMPKKRRLDLIPLPSTSTPTFSRNVLVHEQPDTLASTPTFSRNVLVPEQPETLDSTEVRF